MFCLFRARRVSFPCLLLFAPRTHTALSLSCSGIWRCWASSVRCLFLTATSLSKRATSKSLYGENTINPHTYTYTDTGIATRKLTRKLGSTVLYLLSCSCPWSELPGCWYTDMVGCSIRRSSIGCVGAVAGPPVKVVAGISTQEPSEAIDSMSQSC